MSSKKKILITGSILICLIALIGLNFLLPHLKIELNGERIMEMEYGTKYQEQGAKAYLKSPFKTQNVDVEILGQVDGQNLGKYLIVYQAKYKNKVVKTERIVNIIDSMKPQITLNAPVKACKNQQNVQINATVIDNYDGDISSKLKYNITGDKISLMATDSVGNLTKIEESLTYIDNEPPVITLNGSKTITLTLGQIYNDEKAKASDSCDGDLTDKITITNNVNFSKVGEYTINYTVKDSSNSLAKASRKIIIKAPKEQHPQTPSGSVTPVKNGVIYLTFDDGPGQYTESILNILAKNNIKATFFVTNQFLKYQDLIKKEAEQGHTVGIHTYSHKWSIYNSVDTYLDDFSKIENIVIEKTGVKPKYFRFPGGSSNTVSIKHCKGIMTNLANIMTEKGYVYFDWTFDSGDTAKNNTTTTIINNVKNRLKGDGSYIILMHDIKKNTLNALPTIIEYAKSRGYTFKAIDDTTPVPHFKIAN